MVEEAAAVEETVDSASDQEMSEVEEDDWTDGVTRILTAGPSLSPCAKAGVRQRTKQVCCC